jgi:hypothetical protein
MDVRKALISALRLAITILLLGSSAATFAHSGGLNASGCHGGSKPYHCHRSASEMVGNRLRCDLGSKSKECRGSSTQPRDSVSESVTAPENAFISGSEWYCREGFKADRANNKCLAVYLPENAFISGSEWYCREGFKADRANNKCLAD